MSTVVRITTAVLAATGLLGYQASLVYSACSHYCKSEVNFQGKKSASGDVIDIYMLNGESCAKMYWSDTGDDELECSEETVSKDRKALLEPLTPDCASWPTGSGPKVRTVSDASNYFTGPPIAITCCNECVDGDPQHAE